MDGVELQYDRVRQQIADGDLLLWRPTSLLGRMIATLSRGPYSHAAMATWWGRDCLYLIDMVFTGGRAVTLSSQVSRFPGRIDWYRANPGWKFKWDRMATVDRMRRRAGERYGFANLLRNVLSYSVLTRWLVKPNLDDLENGTPPLCSQAISADYRGGGVDSVLGLADSWTTPNDLARSMFFELQGTLYPGANDD